MSATTGIPSGSLWGSETSLPWSERLNRTRTTPRLQETSDHGPPDWFVKLGQFLLAVAFTIVSVPLLIIGAIVAAVVAAWSILLPALVAGLVIVPSWVRVTRLTYEQVEARLAEEPFATMYAWARRFEARRRENGAVFIDLPEVKIRVEEGEVVIRPLPFLRSRSLVMEAMLMAGEAVARYAVQHQIPLPFTIQDPPDTDDREPARPSAMLAVNG